jgi:hypothetical protein
VGCVALDAASDGCNNFLENIAVYALGRRDLPGEAEALVAGHCLIPEMRHGTFKPAEERISSSTEENCLLRQRISLAGHWPPPPIEISEKFTMTLASIDRCAEGSHGPA